MSRLQETNQSLSVFANSLETASEALRDIVSQGNEEEIRTKQFEELYIKMQANFSKYKDEATGQERKAAKLKQSLEYEIMSKRNEVECLRSEIVGLDKQIRDQDLENERLDRELREKVKQYRLNLDDRTYANASPNIPGQNFTNQRLFEEY